MKDKIMIAVMMLMSVGFLECEVNADVRKVDVGEGFSGTSVNTAVFRTNSLVTDGDTQYVSYYDPEGYLILGKRENGSDNWLTHSTQYNGNVKDGHNIISMGVDGDGFIHELINQTSMTADTESHPYIVTYWRSEDSGVPQYRIIWNDGNAWNHRQITNRTEPFSLSGGDTKMIPIARPRVVTDGEYIGVVFRDRERGGLVSIAESQTGAEGEWTITDITDFDVDAWEPSIDTQLWRDKKQLNIFVQPTHQGDGEKAVESAPTTVSVLEVK